MADPDTPSLTASNETAITLGLLNAVDRDNMLTQRSMAHELGIALGLANAYLKRCIKKGWIKVNQVPTKRYAYYLTPHGFAEKSRLTAEYLSSSLNFFRKARGQFTTVMGDCVDRGYKRIAFYGTGELAEIALICARDHDVQIVAIVDPRFGGERFGGVPVVAALDKVSGIDAVLMTGLSNAQADYVSLSDMLQPSRILVPPMLGVSVRPPVAGGLA